MAPALLHLMALLMDGQQEPPSRRGRLLEPCRSWSRDSSKDLPQEQVLIHG